VNAESTLCELPNGRYAPAHSNRNPISLDCNNELLACRSKAIPACSTSRRTGPGWRGPVAHTAPIVQSTKSWKIHRGEGAENHRAPRSPHTSPLTETAHFLRGALRHCTSPPRRTLRIADLLLPPRRVGTRPEPPFRAVKLRKEELTPNQGDQPGPTCAGADAILDGRRRWLLSRDQPAEAKTQGTGRTIRYGGRRALCPVAGGHLSGCRAMMGNARRAPAPRVT